jgi:glycerol-3-phosphate O-acyltransferase
MNHRSNMDYVLATYLASGRTALSYAVGEWARVWPLSALVRASGAYFIRRKSSDPLYRRVLARYVQMATEAGVTQAIFPEGGLSVDGRVGAAKLGILSYIMEAWRPDGRDVVFVPVALSYDRVFEDAVLVKAAAAGNRRFRAPILPVLWFLVRNAFRKLAGRYKRFGYAAVSLGKPVSLAGFAAEGGEPTVERLAGRIMERILDAMPVLPVPLAAAALGDTGAAEEAELQRRAEAIAEALTARGDHLGLPGGAVRARLRVGIGTLAARGLVRREGGRVEAVPGREAILAYYAAGVRQLLPEAGAPGPGGNNPADAAVPQSAGT